MKNAHKTLRKYVPWLRRLAAVVSPGRQVFGPIQVSVGIVVDQVALVQDFLQILRYLMWF
jgi:hypothetical protein